MRLLQHVIDGRRLYLVAAQRTILDAARLLTAHRISALPVLAGERLVGILTERDLVQRVIALGRDPASTMVAEIMTRDLVVAAPRETYEAALARMKHHGVRHLLVVDGAELVGVVSMRDLMVLAAADRADEIQLLTSYIYAVPPSLTPLAVPEDG
jgi:CBS domain-containing protein